MNYPQVYKQLRDFTTLKSPLLHLSKDLLLNSLVEYPILTKVDLKISCVRHLGICRRDIGPDLKVPSLPVTWVSMSPFPSPYTLLTVDSRQLKPCSRSSLLTLIRGKGGYVVTLLSERRGRRREDVSR